jgi:hypothetical protein
VNAVAVTADGNRAITGDEDGTVLSIEPASSPYSSLRSNPGLPPVGALARLIRASQRTHQVMPGRGR